MGGLKEFHTVQTALALRVDWNINKISFFFFFFILIKFQLKIDMNRKQNMIFRAKKGTE